MSPPRRKTATKPRSSAGKAKAKPRPRNPPKTKPRSSVGKAKTNPRSTKPSSIARNDEPRLISLTEYDIPQELRLLERHSIASPLDSASMRAFTNPVPPLNQITVHFKVAHYLDPQRRKNMHLRSKLMSPLDSVTLNVDPTLATRDLLYKLRPLLWIPFYEDFRLQLIDGRFIDDPDFTLSYYSVKHRDTLLVFMDGYLFHPTYYLRMLDARGDASVALGAGRGEQLAKEGEPQKLNVHFKFINELCPVQGGFSRDSFCLPVSPKMPIGVLLTMLRARFWIPFYDCLQIKQPCGRLLDHGDRTLEEYGVKDGNLLLASLIDVSPFIPRCPRYSSLTPSVPADHTKTMQIFVKAAHYLDEPHRYPERSEDQRYIVRLTVSPTLTIGDLKSLLQLFHWIPRKNLVLFAIKGPSTSEDSGIEILEQDTSTLDVCGVKDGDTLMTCMEDGSFETRVLDYNKLNSIPLSVNSCFQNIGELKKLNFGIKGYLPENQILVSRLYGKPLEDGTPLVLYGIVKTFMAQMDRYGVYSLKLRKPAKQA